MTTVEAPTRRPAILAWALCGVALAEVVIAVAGAALLGWTFQQSLENFVVTNAVMGLAFPLCGALLAWQRPRNPIGWLFIADGIGHATTAAMAPLAAYGDRLDWPEGLLRAMVTVASFAWPWSIGLFLPLALLLFPDGRLVGPRWQWLVGLVAVTSSLFVLEIGTDPAGWRFEGRSIVGYLTISGYDDLTTLWTVSEVAALLPYLAALVALVIRYRRGDEQRRRQLLWLVLALLGVVIIWLPWGVFEIAPIVTLLAIPLIPVAVTIAVLRHRLLDIRLAISRTVLYLLLTSVAVGVYVGLVTLMDSVLRSQVPLGSTALVTVLIAVLFNPVRVRLQRVVDRLLYGERSDPARAASLVSGRLATADRSGLEGVLGALRGALRLPFVGLRVDGVLVDSSGRPPERLHTVDLVYLGEPVGELVIGLRGGEQSLGPDDGKVLDLLAGPLAIAIGAIELSEELQRSRERLVSAREEERRRVRRDLHDGLGPALTGVALKADAAHLLIEKDPGRAADLLAELRSETRQAIGEVRRLVYELRPPTLDELGLVGALEQQAHRLSRREDGGPLRIRIDSPSEVPPLPAAVEVAAYRIATEAMTNTARHSTATDVLVRLTVDDRLHLEIRDNGAMNGRRSAWRAGVGLLSMRERAAELGGECVAGPTDTGGSVSAHLPLDSS